MSKLAAATRESRPKYKLFQLLEALNRPLRGMIQVGANKGQEVSIFRQYGLSPVILIEPLEDAFAHLLGRSGVKMDAYFPGSRPMLLLGEAGTHLLRLGP